MRAPALQENMKNNPGDRITWAHSPAIIKKQQDKDTSLPSVKMVDPAGRIIDLPVATGRNIPHNLNHYGPGIVAKKRRKGWKMVSDCLVAGIEYTSDFRSEKEMHALIKKRREEHAKKQAESELRFQNEQKSSAIAAEAVQSLISAIQNPPEKKSVGQG